MDYAYEMLQVCYLVETIVSIVMYVTIIIGITVYICRK